VGDTDGGTMPLARAQAS